MSFLISSDFADEVMVYLVGAQHAVPLHRWQISHVDEFIFRNESTFRVTIPVYAQPNVYSHLVFDPERL